MKWGEGFQALENKISRKNKMNSPKKSYKNACTIVQTLIEKGYIAYFAGGCVRDHLRGEEFGASDIDIATDAKPEQVKALFKKTIPVGEQFGVVIVVLNGINFEIATFRKDLEYQDGRHPEGVEFVFRQRRCGAT